jgi:hypothetical protein
MISFKDRLLDRVDINTEILIKSKNNYKKTKTTIHKVEKSIEDREQQI